MKVISAEFVKSATHEKDFPEDRFPEVAFAGRSNVGKSSLINVLLNRKRLARTSSRPGCTQVLNFYRLNDRFFFVDLPGYGFAAVPLEVRSGWRPMVEAYLERRETLKLVVLILDIRRDPGNDEVSFLQWLGERSIPTSVVLTKADKASKTSRMKQKQAVRRSLSLGDGQVLVFSARTREGRDAVWKSIDGSLARA
jgi:GTP-binding protein